MKEKEKLTIQIVDDKQGEIATDRNINGGEGLEMVEMAHNTSSEANDVPTKEQIISISAFESEESASY